MAAKTPLTVSLTEELQKYIDRKVASGFYGSASEVIREALRLLERSEQQNAERRKIKEQNNVR